MSTLELRQPGPPDRSPRAPHRALAAVRSPTAPGALTCALLLLVMYAAFSHGAVQSAAEARLQVAVAAVAAIAGGAWLWSGTLRVSAPGTAWVGVGLLAAFTLWSGLSIAWSVAPDQTWIELNRWLTYLVVLGLAITAGASSTRASEWVAGGFLVVSLAVTAYALAQKLVPGLHVAGVFDFNQTGQFARLQEPFGYWNALSLFISMGVPIALALTVDRRRGRRLRLGALLAIELMFLAVGFTYSRGGLIALGLGIAAAVALGGVRLRSLMWLATAVLCTVPPLVLGLVTHSLTTSHIGLAQRESAGGALLGVTIVSALVLVFTGRWLQATEQRVALSPERASVVGRALLIAVGAAFVIALLAVTFSSRGLSGTVSHAWSSFTATRGESVSDPSRLLSADSGNRWVWWKEAAGAFSDRPLGGWGAGSFQVVHLLYRHDSLAVKQPHSVPLQLLAETGLIGTLLALAGLGTLLTLAVKVVRRQPPGSERIVAAALLAGAVAYVVHACYDWDSDIPGVTLPALLFLGVLAGSVRAARARPAPPSPGLRGPGPMVRILGLATLTLGLCCFAVSAALPSIAADQASGAEVAAGGSGGALVQAQSAAALASRLNPLSDAGLRAESTIALHRGDPRQARAYLLAAVRRQPTDEHAWARLAYINFQLGDLHDATGAAQRVHALDPEDLLTGDFASYVATRANVLETPPQASATATPTPRPRGTSGP
ncbi:MAG: O-antigen ligase family protein [Actinomycetota bacterium]|nr:O-antigen ligase family protein [Actinomycetota bacterium]